MANSRKSALPNNGTAAHNKAAFERALEEILARVVVSSSAGLALAYSGGLDSSVLLRLLSRYCASHDIALFAFHIHHGLSPHADAWVAHAERQARAVGAHFVAERVTLIDTSLHGIEQAARLARYAALGRLCRLHQLPLLLTAHHQDDQAETVLLQLLRGAGLPGLAGMGALHTSPPLLGGEVALGRPLLNWSCAQLAALAQHEHIDCITDESNSDTRYRRNAVRQLIAPGLRARWRGPAIICNQRKNYWMHLQRSISSIASPIRRPGAACTSQASPRYPKSALTMCCAIGCSGRVRLRQAPHNWGLCASRCWQRALAAILCCSYPASPTSVRPAG